MALHPTLSADQVKAMTHGDGPCLCLAGPGSGKTMVLTGRIRYLVETLSIDPGKILVVTFTKDAASHMKRRYMEGAGGGSMPIFGTFHSVFYMILRQTCRLDPSGVLSGKQAMDILVRITNIHHMAAKGEEFFPELLRAISCYRNGSNFEDLPPMEGISRERFLFLLQEYQNAKKRAGLIDFDDMIFKTKELLEKDSGLCQRWQQRFQYILVDEAQDMNGIQYRLISLLAKPKNNLFLVGDDDQSIYGFRGATPQFLLSFPEDFPGTEVIRLGKNYRCAPDIVYASQCLISHNTKRFAKTVTADKEENGVVRLITGKDATEEAYLCSNLILELLKRGVLKEEIAVLYRNNAQGKLLYDRLSCLGLVEKNTDVLFHFVARDLLSYLRVATGEVRRRDFLNLLSNPGRGFNRYGLEGEWIDLGKWQQAQTEAGRGEEAGRLCEQIRAISLLSPWAAIAYIRHGMGYDTYLMNEAQKRGLSPRTYFPYGDEVMELAKDYRSIKAFLQEMDRRIALQEEMKKAPSKTKTQGISFHTFHGCKGLEYDTVIILGACEGITPSGKATDAAALEEERRMFYVAMTRAKRQLFISVIGHRSNEVLYPSRFLKEAFEQGIQSLVIPSS